MFRFVLSAGASAPGLLLLPTILLSAPALAQEASETKPRDADIVVTGSKADFGEKSGIPIAQVPQSVQILGKEEFLDRGVQSVGDILKVVPSATVGAARVSSYQAFSVKVRGFRADQIRNGIRQRYYYNVDPSALSNVERIEVLKGPSSVLYGPSLEGGGIVSIITKRPQEQFAGSVSALLGAYDQKSASIDLTGPISKEAGLYFRVTGEIERSGTFVDYTDLDRNNVAASLTLKPSDRVTAYFVGEYQERKTKRGVGLPVVGTVVSNGVARIPISRYLGDPNHDFKASGFLIQSWIDFKLTDAWTLTPRLSYSGFDGTYSELFLRGVQADRTMVNRTGRFGGEPHRYPIEQLDLAGVVASGSIKHNLLFGVEHALEKVGFYERTITNVPAINVLNPVYTPALTGPYPVTSNQNRRVTSWSVYAQDRADLTDRWNVIFALRQSWYDFYRETSVDFTSPITVRKDQFDFFTYSIGSTYRLGGGWSLFGGYGTGFSTEATAGGRSFDGKPFDPDRTASLEVGVRYAGGPFNGSASLFQIKRSNVVTTDPDHVGFSVQTGAVRVRGLELEGTWQLAGGLSLQGGYAYSKGEVTRSNSGNQGFELADTPRHRANAYLRYDVANLPIQVRGGVNYVGERAFSNTANVVLAPGLLANTVRLPSYTTVDLGATYRFGRSRLDLTVINVTGKTYFTRDFNDYIVIPGEPRQANVRLTVDF